MSVDTTPARLVLEDGAVFAGESCGGDEEGLGEVVFCTAMTGYQEALTDPSYRGQILVMTAPHIGNYGVCEHDLESTGPQVAGFVVREMAEYLPAFGGGRVRGAACASGDLCGRDQGT